MSADSLVAELRHIDLAWWPEFLLHCQEPICDDEDSFTVSLLNLAVSLVEEDSLA